MRHVKGFTLAAIAAAGLAATALVSDNVAASLMLVLERLNHVHGRRGSWERRRLVSA